MKDQTVDTPNIPTPRAKIPSELEYEKCRLTRVALWEVWKKAERELSTLQASITKRDGSWIDEWGACKVCDGEIPAGHTKNCDIYKLEQKITTLQAEVVELRKDKERLDWLDKSTFTNREGDKEIHYDYRGDFRTAIDAARKDTP